MNPGIVKFKEKAIEKGIDLTDASDIYAIGQKEPFLVLAYASEIREHFKGRKISLCGIVNAKSGICPENCKFCAQSAHYQTTAPVYPLISAREIVEKGEAALKAGAGYFGIVTSGTRIDDQDEWQEIYEAIAGLKRMGIKPCASLGMLDSERAAGLASAGLFRYHHNLETSRSFFDNICSTHAYDEDIHTVAVARRAGLSVCSGGIIGLGEKMEHRIELALTLKELNVDSVPINILNPIAGTPLEGVTPLTPMEILLTVALFRFILPDKDIKLCGGKEKNLRQLLPLAIVAGSNSLMTGNYLTTTGRDSRDDVEMIEDLGCGISMF
ncbi:MAG TPA: biotin synthase BioB [Syntrophorhabdaceae bacterium]|nr:biotin synthase BioB [Syntrophorhabdaceae bacterium]